ncbi:MAG: hypothetical protein WCU90_06600, partial [Kiritimatiellia bacterium]
MRSFSESSSRKVVIKVVVVLALGVCFSGKAALVSDDFESGLGAWSVTGGWSATASDAHSPTRSATDSPGSYYTNNTDAALMLGLPLDFSEVARPAVRFYHRHALETDFDWGSVEL